MLYLVVVKKDVLFLAAEKSCIWQLKRKSYCQIWQYHEMFHEKKILFGSEKRCCVIVFGSGVVFCSGTKG